MKILEKTVDLSWEGMTLEKIMREGLNLTKRQISQAKFRENGICVNGIRQRISYRPKAGDRLQILMEEAHSDTGKVCPVVGKIQIVYEDEDVIVADKTGGVACHPGRGHYDDSLANMLAGYLCEKGEKAPVRAVGRLDKDTSGMVVFAKNQPCAARLAKQRAEGTFGKEYLAVIHGIPKQKQGRVMAPMGKMPGEKMKMQVLDQGKAAETFYQVLDTTEAYSLVKCRITTGRTHQIRVHMAWLGHPLLGDVLYGSGSNALFHGLALHAWKVWFEQPFTGERVVVKSVPAHWGKDFSGMLL